MQLTHVTCASSPITSPRPEHIVCARGRVFWSHPGNVWYRSIIAKASPQYGNARTKVDKSTVIDSVVAAIGPDRAIVRSKKVLGWTRASRTLIREKVTQSLRDSLSQQYKSSTQHKRKRQAAWIQQLDVTAEKILRSNLAVSMRLDHLAFQVAQVKTALDEKQSAMEDELMERLFIEANCDLLASFKKDDTLCCKFQLAMNSKPTKSR